MEEQILGDYRILKPIGVGALGRVLLAEHRFIKKEYVLKVLPEEFAQDKNFIERFEEEVAKLSKLEHPHLVKIHNISFAEGVYFLVTDCIVDSFGETTNLAQYMAWRKERLQEEELLSILMQIAEALDYAHLKAGIAHRAFKLNNILIGKGAPGIKVFISDLGLSKILSAGKVVTRTFKVVTDRIGILPVSEINEEKYDPNPCALEKLSQLSRSFLQNYAFFAPEQKRFEEVDAAADVYAFGILAHFLISGRFPEGIFEMPSMISPDYQIDWDGVVTECLHQDPKKRAKELVPLLKKKKKIGQTVTVKPNIVEEIEKEDAKLRPPPHQMTHREEPLLKPLISRNFEKITSPQAEPAAALATVSILATKSLKEASPLDYEEAYAQQLNAMLNREPVVTQYLPEKRANPILEPLQTEMAIIQGGIFGRGSNDCSRDETPCHKVKLKSFALDIHPVTCEQFLRFLEFMGSEKDQNYNDLIRLKDSRLSRAAGQLSIESGYAKHPIVGVTWYGAVAYAKWAGKRLPTEAEWEIAARGGLENCIYPTGNHIEKSQANFFSSDTTPVMSYPPNAYGLYDMAGNVYEWCQDWYGYNYYETAMQEPNNPKGPLQGVYRVLRGGCWKSLHEDMRCSYRHRNNPGTVNSTYGFRCAADVL